ncbi:MAG: hypothetical protein AAGN82_18300 [Myxococcota bacterium]
MLPPFIIDQIRQREERERQRRRDEDRPRLQLPLQQPLGPGWTEHDGGAPDGVGSDQARDSHRGRYPGQDYPGTNPGDVDEDGDRGVVIVDLMG